jgi:hypothetical protein
MRITKSRFSIGWREQKSAAARQSKLAFGTAGIAVLGSARICLKKLKKPSGG